MLEEKPEYKKRKKYTKRRQQVIRQLFFTGVAVVVVIIGCATWTLKSDNMARKADIQAKTSQTGRKADAAKTSVENGVQANSEAVKEKTDDKDTSDTTKKTETTEERIARVRQEAVTAGYPEKVIELLDKNPETVQFVEDYGKKKDQAPAATVEAEDGYSGMFPEILQWDERWGYSVYGDNMIAVNGCGPTAVAMVVSGLLCDPSVTPYKVAKFAEEQGYYAGESGTSWTLMSEGVQSFGIWGEELGLSRSEVFSALESGCPIICSMRPGDFTTTGHFIVLTKVENGKIKVNDPNSRIRSGQLWDYERLEPQIQNLWAFSRM